MCALGDVVPSCGVEHLAQVLDFGEVADLVPGHAYLPATSAGVESGIHTQLVDVLTRHERGSTRLLQGETEMRDKTPDLFGHLFVVGVLVVV